MLRRWHNYLGALIAPSLLFFALTGALQIFSLHEAHGEYKPPTLIERLGRLHKDQVFALGDHHGPPPSEAPDPAGGGSKGAQADDDQPALATTLLKWFFLLVALGLMVSTGLGVWIGLIRARGRMVTLALLAAGAVIPVTLLLL